MGPVSNTSTFASSIRSARMRSPRSRVASPRPSRVLDLGCGPGVLGERLTTEKSCVVDGIEANPAAAALAAKRLHRVVVADLEDEALAGHLGAERYDFIVCADVLEHLRRPETVLTQLTALLRPEGRVLLSIPNVGYTGLVGALLNGDFRYRSEGLLDETHLRFFTRASLVRLSRTVRLSRSRTATPSRCRSASPSSPATQLEVLPPAVLRTLLARPDALTYQFVTELAPAGTWPRRPPRNRDGARLHLHGAAYHRGAEPFEALAAAPRSARWRTNVRRYAGGPCLDAAIEELRLDPSNRPGYLRLYAMRLLTADGAAPVAVESRGAAAAGAKPAAALDRQCRR